MGFTGVSVFDGANWQTHNSGSQVNAIAKDGIGNYYLGVLNNGLKKTSDFSAYTSYGVSEGLLHSWVQAIAVDASDSIWIGSDGGLSVLKNNVFKNYTTSNGLLGNVVKDIKFDGSGGVWIATNGGVSHYLNGVWDGYTTSDGLVSNIVTAIEIDANGNKWFGTEDLGLSKLSGSTWTTINTSNGLPDNMIYDLLWENNTLWVGCMGGLGQFKNNVWEKYYAHDGLVSGFIKKMAVDQDGNLWIATTSGVSMMESMSINVNQSVHKTNMKIFPNPCTAQLNVEVESKSNIRILNIYGQVVFEKSINSGAIDVSGLEEGMYFLQCKGSNGIDIQSFIKVK